MKHKKIVIGCSAAFAVFSAIVAIGAWSFYTKFIQPFGSFRPETPTELSEARVITGADNLTRTQFFHTGESAAPGKSIGSISDLAVKRNKESSSVEIVIAGDDGALIVDQSGTKKAQAQYEFETVKEKIGIFDSTTTTTNTMLGDMQIIDLEGDNVFEYMGRGSIDGAAVFDNQGKRLWAYGKYTDEKTSIDGMTTGDLDGDDIHEFVVYWNALELFDRHGAMKWRQETKYSASHIEVVDTDGDGKNEIAYSSMGDLIIRDGNGQVVKQVEMPFYISQFTLCPLPGNTGTGILAFDDGYLWLTDFNGKIAARFEAPLSEFDNAPRQTTVGNIPGTSVYKSKGAWVKLRKGEPEYLAVITEFAAIDRSVLYIFKSSGEILYQEVLPEQCSSIAVLPGANADDSQEVLIGGKQTIWQYKAR